MNVEIGIEAAQFLFWKHINGIFIAVSCKLAHLDSLTSAPCQTQLIGKIRQNSQFGKNLRKHNSFSYFNNATSGGTVKD